ncbi:BMP family ABC transporter substrate-binding protein [Paenibacillus sp. CGMCC 1.16610]|uniref:BMP family ABC transporter substrate-binding protein n=2 Tax=Paenibacillus TaxID=44249 RepID=A0ABU6DKP0_9BACL|nr:MULTISPECIES: BMP family ABC transporter substrate-binding protein [Paenibacillus]MBA2943630.1 BMP family ABC transporter substrate-binding protein [Paenibacillus sp. CGMCC 1.16610]MCY9661040.1 BMP family ABC transporter substrate-binding protein [Paenibacillus anseongense]MEB4797900.1 BMP family ABC transporter substrate-binding protein [Paenibacillus chondroitinus]MVQ33126.1 BMP family ABC transporter substrate-binding protein [Paenibacillus anseongense]
MPRKLMLSLTAIFLVILSACSSSPTSTTSTTTAPASSPAAASTAGTTPSTPTEKKLPRVAFVYIGVPGDGGWTYEHDQGRLMMEKELGIKATTVENIPEGPDAERVFEELAQKNDIIFGTSFGYMDPMYNVAQKHPNVKFLHATGYKTLPNMGTYMGREYQSAYLVGMAAGKMTKNNHMGYVGAFPIPEVIYTINAFTLGAQSVNPNVDVSVVWSNTWFDPATEKQAAISLLDKGVDVLAAYQDSPAGIQAAAERKVWGIGNDSDMGRFAPETYISNPKWNWGPYYVKTVKSVMDGTWKSEAYFGSMKEGITEMAPLGKNVPADVKELIEKKKQEILAGTFDVFQGPIVDQDGKVRFEQGKKMTDEEILGTTWFVKGIKGVIPK